MVGGEFQIEHSPVASLIMGVPGAAARGAMLRAGNCYIEMFQWSAPRGRDRGPLAPYDFGYTHSCVDVADIDQEFERLSALGMTFAHPSPVHNGPRASVYGRDPDGNIIEIVELPPEDALHLDVEGFDG